MSLWEAHLKISPLDLQVPPKPWVPKPHSPPTPTPTLQWTLCVCYWLQWPEYFQKSLTRVCGQETSILCCNATFWQTKKGFQRSTWWVVRTGEGEVAQSCPTLCDPMDCSLPGFSIHEILQARILEWVAISFSRRSSWPRNWTQVSHIVARRFTIWATREIHSIRTREGIKA